MFYFFDICFYMIVIIEIQTGNARMEWGMTHNKGPQISNWGGRGYMLTTQVLDVPGHGHG